MCIDLTWGAPVPTVIAWVAWLEQLKRELQAAPNTKAVRAAWFAMTKADKLPATSVHLFSMMQDTFVYAGAMKQIRLQAIAQEQGV